MSTEPFDPTLVSAVLEADEAAIRKIAGMERPDSSIERFRNARALEGDLRFIVEWLGCLEGSVIKNASLARRVIELEAERDEKTSGRTYREWAERMDDCRVIAEQERDQLREQATHLEGQRDRAFALMAEMDKFIIRAREAEAIVRDLALSEPIPDIDDPDLLLCPRCVEPVPDHHMGCMVPRARKWATND